MDGLKAALNSLAIMFVVMIPLSLLGLWKLAEIVIWIVKHVRIV